MKTMFDTTTRNEIIHRVNTLSEHSKAQWGRMNIHQMLKHCTLWEEMIAGKIVCKRIFMGRLFGKMALKNSLKGDTPMMRNAITAPELVVKENHGDLLAERKKWIALIEGYAHFSNNDFVHPFFGKMTKEQIGYHAYQHSDHHLRQFNA